MTPSDTAPSNPAAASFNTLCKELGFTRSSPMQAMLASPMTWQQSEWNIYYVRAAVLGRRPVSEEWMRWSSFMHAAVGSLVCLHCRGEAEAWMRQHPPDSYISKPWPALQYVMDMQNNVNERLGLRPKTPTDVLKRLADLTRPPIKASATSAQPSPSLHSVTATAAGAAAAAVLMRALSILRRR
jgi:hypothetical protein